MAKEGRSGLIVGELCYVLLCAVLMIACQAHAQTQPASFFFGQTYMKQPTGIAIHPTTRSLFVADSENSRILIYANIDTVNSTSIFDYYLGQTSNTGIGYACGPGSLYHPQSIFVDSTGRLWVADTFNNRVLWWNSSIAMISGSSASGVVGQPSLYECGNSTNLQSMFLPSGVMVYNNVLWVADSQNNRILRFDGASTLPPFGATASGVIGQSTFGGCSPSLLRYPYGIFVNSQGLYAAEFHNYRVVFFPNSQLTLANGAAATYVYGQENLTTCSPQGMPTPRSSLASPLGVTVTPDGSALFITDYGNNRVVLHSVTPPTLPNGQAAVDVFGQPNFTSINAGSATSLTGLSRPTLTLYDPVKDSLWVTDLLNNRVMAYTNVLVSVNNNISGLDVHLTFVGRSPSVWMYPKNFAGNFSPGLQQVLLHPYKIEEIEAGQVVNTVVFPPNTYTFTTSIDANKNQYFTFTLQSPSSITITYTLFAVESNLTNAGVSFLTNPSALKFQIGMKNWNWQGINNTLRLHMSVHVTPAATSIPSSTFPALGGSGTITQYTIISGNNVFSTKVNLIGYGVADGVNTPVSFALDNPNNNCSILALKMDFPYFASSFLYDPDFSVTVDNSFGSGGDGSSNQLPLLALIALIFVPAALILIVVTIFVAIWLVKWRDNNALKKAADPL